MRVRRYDVSIDGLVSMCKRMILVNANQRHIETVAAETASSDGRRQATVYVLVKAVALMTP